MYVYLAMLRAATASYALSHAADDDDGARLHDNNNTKDMLAVSSITQGHSPHTVRKIENDFTPLAPLALGWNRCICVLLRSAVNIRLYWLKY